MRPTTTCADLAEEHQVWAWMAEMWAKVAENYEGARKENYGLMGAGPWRLDLVWTLRRLLVNRNITKDLYDRMMDRCFGSCAATYDAAGARVRAKFCARMARETRAERGAARRG